MVSQQAAATGYFYSAAEKYLYNKVTKTHTTLSHNFWFLYYTMGGFTFDLKPYICKNEIDVGQKDLKLSFGSKKSSFFQALLLIQLFGKTWANRSKSSFLLQMVRGVNRD